MQFSMLAEVTKQQLKITLRKKAALFKSTTYEVSTFYSDYIYWETTVNNQSFIFSPSNLQNSSFILSKF